MSGPNSRSASKNGTRALIASCTSRVAGPGSSGDRRSSACAAASASRAITVSAFATTSRACRADVMPMLTWSSCPALEGIESTEAGCASDLHSLTSDAAVYCTSMKPEFSPEPCTRNGGSPLD